MARDISQYLDERYKSPRQFLPPQAVAFFFLQSSDRKELRRERESIGRFRDLLTRGHTAQSTRSLSMSARRSGRRRHRKNLRRRRLVWAFRLFRGFFPSHFYFRLARRWQTRNKRVENPFLDLFRVAGVHV